ncbi:hypothetical protein CEXT_762591 [Caerostris extrusa]|uniref:Uncharacterized protein n=1 Tax=Caerostris extrusa TaxID=172846 RepID=A0AAV4S3U4_CAEEX|nr:hypothetical protein CEXT_762591 [Caerostris extrusa]
MAMNAVGLEPEQKMNRWEEAFPPFKISSDPSSKRFRIRALDLEDAISGSVKRVKTSISDPCFSECLAHMFPFESII